MAATTTIRVEQQIRDRLLALAKQEHKPLGEVVKAAVDRYERDKFFAAYHKAYAELKTDPAAWANFQAEVALWDTTSSDGLGDDPWSEE